MKARFQDGCDGGMPVPPEKRLLARCRLFHVLALALAATVADAATVHTAEPPADVTVVDAGNAGPEEREVTRRITVLLQAADAGEPTAQKVYEAAELGMAALWEAAGRMNLDQETHRAPFILLAEQTAAVRRTQRELLRLYDPPAYRAFYTPDGSRLQARIARALQWKNPPANLLAAMVLAAPEPTLAWLEAQDEEALREPARLLEILRVWGGVVALGREHAFIHPLRAVGERLARSPAVNANDRLLVGVIRFLGDLNCRGAAESVTAWLEHPNAAVRRAAVETLGRLRGDTALNALIDRVPKETDAEAQGLLANALGRWPGDPAAGDACLDLYARSPSQEARRSVLNAAGRATWPARDPLVRRAFEHRDGGALIALAIKPVPGLEDGLLQRLHESEGRLLDPSLLDAELAECAREGRQVLAVVPTDLYGQCCNLPLIRAVCDRHHVPVICDSAEAMGAKYKGIDCGGMSRPDSRAPNSGLYRHAGFDAWASVYSFNGNKIITTSGGGMLASHDKVLIDHARKLATQARDPAPWYEHTEIGFNYRMTDAQAAVGVEQ
ncbi:MAG: DegT/DnrJ/EryC1/StrS family aminotransferase, partial [bacterium]